jgi:hypothetical protein
MTLDNGLGALNFIFLADEDQPYNDGNNHDRGARQQTVKEVD